MIDGHVAIVPFMIDELRSDIAAVLWKEENRLFGKIWFTTLYYN